MKPIKTKDRGAFSALWARYGFAAGLVLITVTALFIYSNTLNGAFLVDDQVYILENADIRSLSNFLDLSGTRYVAYLSFALNYALGGYSTFGYHLVNVLIHIMNALLLWWLISLTFETPAMKRPGDDPRQKYFVSLATALIFVSHPVGTQAVSYVTQRFTSLAALFYLLSLVLYIKARLTDHSETRGAVMGEEAFKAKTLTFYLLSILSAVFAMKTKETSFTLPLVIAVYEFIFLKAVGGGIKKRLFYLAPFILTLLIIPLTLFSPELGLGAEGSGITEEMRTQKIAEMTTLSRHDYLITQFSVIVTYLRLLILPVGQHLYYDYPLYKSFFEGRVLFSFLLLMSLFCLAVYLIVRSRRTGNALALPASFGILWFFMTLSVESSVIPIKDVIFEHRLYLPGMGLMFAFSSSLFLASEAVRMRSNVERAVNAGRWAVIFVMVAAFSMAAHTRNKVWTDELAFWSDEVRKFPDNARLHNDLGLAYMRLGRLDEAVSEYKLGLELIPDYADIHYNLGLAYQKLGRTEEAVEEYKTAITLEPGIKDAHNNLGLLYEKVGRIGDAVRLYTEAISTHPYDPNPHFNLGRAYGMLGRLDEAIEELAEAARLNPSDAKIHYFLGVAYTQKGLKGKALGEFEEALRIRPDFKKAREAVQALSR